jgi:hypothetical protein
MPAEARPDSLYAAPEAAPLRAEPREITPRKPIEELRTPPITSIDSESQPQYKGRESSKLRSLRFKSRLLRVGIPCALLLILFLGFAKLSRYLKANSLTQPAKPVPTASTIPSRTPIEAAPFAAVPAPPPTVASTVMSSELPVSVPPDLVSPSSATDPEPPPQAGAVARRMVEQFLAATTFEERILYVLTKKSSTELQNSILTAKWPTAQITPGAQIPHPSERLTEFYFEVRFGENSVGFPREATILVHQRGDEEPKIILEPLLDTVGGRLRAFAKEPSSKPQDFYVIMDARSRCFDDKIPAADKKSTFFLRSHTTGVDIATAYANEVSHVRKEFDNPLAGFKWKKPMPVVVTLQWNTTEDYTRPFIEVIDIRAKSWNP